MEEISRKRVLEALESINVANASYDEWLKVGMALEDAQRQGANLGLDDWIEWSRADSERFDEDVCNYKWEGFNDEGVAIGTLFHIAKQYGYTPSSADEVYGWNDVIHVDDAYSLGERPNDTLKYLKALFKPDDIVGFNFSLNANGPVDKGIYGLSAGMLMAGLSDGKSINEVFMDYDHRYGGLIRINPLDGTGVADKNVKEYRNVLVESDAIPTSEQLEIIKRLNLPCRTIVNSGNKSIHAIVAIDASNEKEYETRVKKLFSKLDEYGFETDQQNKNPSRLSRLPGLIRGDKEQKLLAVNTGCSSFTEWEQSLNSLENDLPEVIYFDEVARDGLEPLPPELIQGVLRQGNKMLITGPTKTGKSMLMLQLAVSLTTGGEWLGFKCRRSKVCLIDFEVRHAELQRRIQDTYDAMNIDPKEYKGMFGYISGRGKAKNLSKLKGEIIDRVEKHKFDAIILDPIYKIQGGDENSAQDITAFTNELDDLAERLNISLIYIHHHPKGDMGVRKTSDRGSGSGVFTRDPDACIDLIELDPEEAGIDGGHIRAFRVGGDLRSFENFGNVNAFFKYPLFIVDENGELDDVKIRTDFSKTKKERVRPSDKLEKAFKKLAQGNTQVDISELTEELGIGIGSLKNLMAEHKSEGRGYYFSKRGDVIKLIKRS